MGKEVSRGQALEVSSRCGNGTLIDWGEIDGDKLQAEVVVLPPEEIGRRMTAFIKNGMRFILGGLKVVCPQFDPAKFFVDEGVGEGRTFWRGPKDGNGLEGEEERDKIAAALPELDFATAKFLACLKKGEPYIPGEVRLVRLRELHRTIYGANQFLGLWQDYQSCQNKADSVLEKLHSQGLIGDYVDFPGDVLRAPSGHRCVLYLYRSVGGSWYWRYHWLDHYFNEQHVSAVSQ